MYIFPANRNCSSIVWVSTLNRIFSTNVASNTYDHSLPKGRCARAGRKGTAYSIVSTDDEAHLIDLHLFLNRPFDIANRNSIGIIPQDVLEEEHAVVMEWLSNQHIVSYRNLVLFLIVIRN